MRAAVLLAAALLAATVPLASAAEPCVPAAADRYEPLGRVAGLPQGWVPLLALDDSRIPAIASLAASGPGGLCSVTADVAAFAGAAGVDDARDRAALAIAAAYPDVLGVPEVLSLEFDGGVARASSWSAKDGLVVDWVVDLGTLRADFVVRQVGVGDHASVVEGWHPWVGFSSELLRGLEAGTLITKEKFVPLPDGKRFRLTYFTQFYASEAQADQYAADYAAASLAIWTIQNQQWGFVSGDPDGTYDIRMDGCSCISGGFNVAIRVHAKLEDLLTLFNPPLQYPTFQHFYRVVIGHEWHHHLQYTINQWALGNYLTEGGARFSETIFEAEGAFGPNTIQTLPNGNGFAYMLLNPNLAPTSHSYSLGLFWGYMYGLNGGIDFLKRLYVEADAGGSLYQVIDRTLEAMPDPTHETFVDAYEDFAIAYYKKEFLWASPGNTDVRDWGTYLPAVRMDAMTALGPGAAMVEGDVASQGIRFWRVPAASAPIVAAYGGDAALKARWVWTAAGGAATEPAGNVVVLDDPLSDPALVVVRGNAVPNDPGARVFGAGKFKAAVAGPGTLPL